MRREIYDYTINYTAGNGPPEQVRATRQFLGDGVLHLFYQTGPAANDEEHVGSWPLTSVRSWKRVAR